MWHQAASSNLLWYRQMSRFPQCRIRLFTLPCRLLMMPLTMAGFAGGEAGVDAYVLSKENFREQR